MAEFAPLYSTRERILIALKVLAVATPVYLAGYYWMFPRLRLYAITANCDRFGAVNGLQLLSYGLFAGVPLAMALLVWLIAGPRSLRVWRLGQNPLPGERVLRRTRYRYGAAARVWPLAVLAIIALLAGIAIRGGFEARALLRDTGPCADPGQSRTAPGTADETLGSIPLELLNSSTRQHQRNHHGSIQM